MERVMGQGMVLPTAEMTATDKARPSFDRPTKLWDFAESRNSFQKDVAATSAESL